MRRLVAFALLLLLASLGTRAMAEPVSFVAMGDIPYGDEDSAQWTRVRDEIKPAIEKGNHPFVIFYGDMKSGGARCVERDFENRRDLIYGLKPGAVFFTPGDNDWTDCDRAQTGERDELKWLETVRSVFYGAGVPTLPDWNIEYQKPDFPENARWDYGGVHFVTLHVVGTDNGRQFISDATDVATALAAVRARDDANAAWLDQAFHRAETQDAAAVVVAFQADPDEIRFEDGRDRPCAGVPEERCNPYLPLMDRLRRWAAAFDRPVLLIHGSTDWYWLDRDFGAGIAPKLWRLNGPGDGVVNAAVVTVDPENDPPFAVRLLLY